MDGRDRPGRDDKEKYLDGKYLDIEIYDTYLDVEIRETAVTFATFRR